MENNPNEPNENKKPAFPLLRTSKLGALRPSQFALNSDKKEDASNTNGSKESTSKAFNPFMKLPSAEDGNDVVEKPSTINNEEKTEGEEKELDPIAALARNGIPKSNLFSNTTVPISSSNPGFVFGENVHERVTGDIVQNVLNSESNNKKENDISTAEQPSASGSGLLFSSAVQAATAGTTVENQPPKESTSKSLTEAAREYEESRAQKRKYGEVETFTGEEDENNVIEVNCKLFTFVASTYEERGRGTLRLNDSKKKGESSRVVFRTAGNLRVLVNTKIWSGMVAERPSQKSFRFTAIDSEGHIKVFLIMASPEILNQLHNHLTERINIEKTRTNDENTPPPSILADDIKEPEPDDQKSENDSEEPSPKKPLIET